MDFVGPVVQLVNMCWDPVSRRVGYLTNLSHNIKALERETKEIKHMHEEVHDNVGEAELVGKRRVRRVHDWLKDAGDFITEVESIRSEFDQRQTCLMGCFTDYVSRYKLGKRVVEKMEYAKNLKSRGVFDKAAVAVSPPRPTVLNKQISLPRETQNTFEQSLEEVWQCLHDDQNAIICVYGIGGIGKTTLMAAIEKRLSGNKEFNVVIWVTVSKDLRLELIQESIGRQLAIQFEPNEDKRSRLFSRLENIRYMLILDDLWKAFSLDYVGIPKPNKQNGCKIAITTRSIEVCNDMGANKKIQANILTNEEAWSLFREKAGDVVLLPEIQPLAEEVVKECGGLPLAIKVVGGAMKEKNKKELWRNTLRALKSSAVSEVRGMESKVFIPLKHSYDSLENTKLQSCFLYFSLFPEDHEIPIEQLVRYWAVGEEWVGNTIALQEALDEGYAIIERLKDSCLLEGVEGKSRHVRMHDLIRDLAVWILCSSSSSSRQAAKFLIKAGEGLEVAPEAEMWECAKRISLMKNKLVQLQIKPCCSNLVTLLLCENYYLNFIPDGFFENMPQLQILDLSGTRIKALPASLSDLKNLRALICRNCPELVEIPTLTKLGKLQLLDLYECRIKMLPDGMADLTELRQLYLDGRRLTTLPCDFISRLKSLEDLSLARYEIWGVGSFREAATLPHLTGLSISLWSFNGFTANDMHYRYNWKALRRFEISVGDYYLGPFNEILVEPYDKRVWICGQESLPLWIDGLTKHAEMIWMTECKGVGHVTQLIGQSRSIRFISVDNCPGLECIVDGRQVGPVGSLDWLEVLRVSFLVDLKRVFIGVGVGELDPMPRPTTLLRIYRLRIIEIRYCDNLKHVFSYGMVEQLHHLQELSIQGCCGMVEIIGGEGDSLLPPPAAAVENLLPRLKIIRLNGLRELERIGSQRLVFTSLEDITLRDCPALKKLPVLCSGIQRLRGEIKGSREWWEGMSDADPHSNSIYSAIYSETHST